MISVVDLIFAVIYNRYPYVANYARPFVILLFLSSIRANIFELAHDLKESFLILCCILAYVMMFVVIGFYLFRESFQEVSVFTDKNATFYQMTILLTTANFPDVMLPAYNVSYLYSIFFISYLMIGLYLLLNLLLANIFTKFTQRLESRAKERTKKRKEQLEKFFNQFKKKNPGVLDLTESKQFFAFVLDLDYHKKSDQQTFKRIMNIIDPDETKIVTKEDLLEFFSIPGFLNLARVE